MAPTKVVKKCDEVDGRSVRIVDDDGRLDTNAQVSGRGSPRSTHRIGLSVHNKASRAKSPIGLPELELPHVRTAMFGGDTARTRVTIRARQRVGYEPQSAGAIQFSKEFRCRASFRRKDQTIGSGALVCTNRCLPQNLATDGVRVRNQIRFEPQLSIWIQREVGRAKGVSAARVCKGRWQPLIIKSCKFKRHAP
jgi:hypothetical protein